MPTPVTIQVKLDSKQAEAAAAELNKRVSAAFAAMRESLAALSAQMRELTFDPAGILRGTDQAARGFESAERAAAGAAREMQSLTDGAARSGEGLASLEAQATGAGAKMDRLAGTTSAAGAAFSALESASGAADAALLSLDDGAAAAGKSVAGMGRAAASALPKLDALSGAAFDPAGVVAGADEAAAALGRVKIAAAETRGALRGAGSGAPIFLGGGRRGMPAGERAGGFGGGFRAGASAAGDLAGGGAAVLTLAAAVTGKLSVAFDNMLQGVKGNTTMTDADGQRMRRTTLGLMRTGSKDEEIAKAYGHVENMNYTGKDADAIVTQANKMGIATHTNVEDTGQVLARLLREYNQPASRVNAVAETAHLTSAGGDMYLKEFDKYAGKAYASGANSKVNMPEVSAMLRAMTQHGLNIAQASTQVVGLVKQIRNPTPQAFKYAKSIGLGDYFGSKGLEKYQPSGVLAAVAAKTGGDPAKISNIFGGQRGGMGVAVLTGMGKDTYDDALNNKRTGTKAAFAGKTNAIDPLFNAQMKQTQQQFAALGGEIKSDFIPIGERLGPVFAAAIPLIRTTANVVKILLDGFTKLPRPVQEAVLGLGALKILTSFLPMLGGFALVSERTAATLGGLGKMLLGLGGAAAEGEAGMAGTAAVMSGPFALGVVAVVAAVAALALAWKTDFGGIRETTAKVAAAVKGFVTSQFGYVVHWFQANLPLIRETVKTVLGAMQQFWHDHGQRILAILGPLWSFIKTLFSAALHIILAVVSLAMHVLTGHWGAAAKDIGVVVTNLWAVVKSLFVNGAKAVGNTLALIASLILDAGIRWEKAGLDAAKQAVDGVVNGIKAGIGRVAGAAKSLAEAVPSAVMSALDIHSPSRVMHKLGVNTAEGLAGGITAGKSGVTAAMRGVVQAALAETDHKKAVFLIDHEARQLRAGGMSASDVADFRESAKAQLPGRTAGGDALDRGRGSRAGTGEAIAEAAWQKFQSGASRSYHGLCEGLAHDTYRAVTGAYERIMDGGPHNSALKTLHRFEKMGLAERYTPGMDLPAGSLLYSQTLGHGDGHVSTIGPHGERLDQHGANAFPARDYQFFVPPPGAEKDARRGRLAETAAERERDRIAKAQAGARKRDAVAAEARAQMKDSLEALTGDPENMALGREEASAKKHYRARMQALGAGADGPYSAQQQTDFAAAERERDLVLQGIEAKRSARQKAAQTAAAEEADAAEKSAANATVQLNRELWQHAGGDMKAYFQSLRAEADAALKSVQDKFGPASAHPNAPAVAAAVAEHTARVQVIGQQQGDAENSLADARQEHDLAQGKISLAEYVAYLTKRRDAYAEYSQAWLDLDSRVYAADEEMQRKQLQSIEDLFQAKKISLDAYKQMLAALAQQVPVQSSVHEDVVRAGLSADTKIRRGETVGGTDFWDSLAGSAAENGSRILTALLHPKDKKSIFKSLWTDLAGSLESGVTGQFSKMLKNMITGAGSGGGGGFLGSLFGRGKPNAGAAGSPFSAAGSPAGAMGAAGLGAMASFLPGLGGLSPLGLFTGGLPGTTGINGPVGGLGAGGSPLGALGGAGGSPLGLLGMLGGKGGLAGLLGHGGLAGLLGHGGLASLGHLLPWLGGGLLLNSALGNPLGKALKGIKKLFHFAGGGIVRGTGTGDTVPAMLTPDEMVLPVPISKAVMAMAALPDVPRGAARVSDNAGGTGAQSSRREKGRAGDSVVIHQTGDHIYHTEMDVRKANRDLARTMERARRGGVPSAA